MHRRFVPLACAAALAAGCATTKGAQGPTEEKLRVKNSSVPFDLINCFPPKLQVPKPANEAILAGYWVAAQPFIQECLVDPANRGPDKTASVKVTLTVDETGGQQKVDGVNLTPAGQQCVQAVFQRLPPLAPLPKGKKPVTLSEEYPFNADQNPAVVMGFNEASDIAGQIRLSQKQWCECFQPWSAAAPHPLSAQLTVTKAAGDQKVPPQVVFTPAADASSQQVQSCLQGKVAALPFNVQSAKVSVPYSFVLTNTGADAEVTDAPANIQVTQLDGMRARKSTQTAFKLGQRANAAVAYDALVQKFRKNSRSVTVKELKDKCQAMLKADEDYAKALEQQMAVEQQTATTVGQLKAQDARWANTEALSQKNAADTQKELQSAKTARVNDEKACPRVSD